MTRMIAALGVAMAVATSGGAFAKTKSCTVVGTWTDSYGTTLDMTTSKKGTAGGNQECNNETANIATTTLSATVWDLKITSKKCTVVITGDYNFAAGSCTSATGTITIPGVGTLPDTLTLTSAAAAHRAPAAAPRALTRGMK